MVTLKAAFVQNLQEMHSCLIVYVLNVIDSAVAKIVLSCPVRLRSALVCAPFHVSCESGEVADELMQFEWPITVWFHLLCSLFARCRQ